MENRYKELKTELFFVGLISIASGLCMVIWPETVQTVICYVMGGLLTISGIYSLAMIFVQKEERPFTFRLIPAAVSIVLGIFFLFSATFVFDIIWVLFGAILIANAYFKFEYGYDLKHEKYDKWWINLILATVSIIFGVLIIAKPSVVANYMMMFTGIFMLVDGICDLVATYLYASFVHSVNVRIRKEIREEKRAAKAEAKQKKQKEMQERKKERALLKEARLKSKNSGIKEVFPKGEPEEALAASEELNKEEIKEIV